MLKYFFAFFCFLFTKNANYFLFFAKNQYTKKMATIVRTYYTLIPKQLLYTYVQYILLQNMPLVNFFAGSAASFHIFKKLDK